MERSVREFRYFFFSQAFADGLRTTVSILTPALLGFYFGQFEIGMTIALGALCVSISDAPGPLLHRRNGMLFTAFFIFLVSLITAICRTDPYLLGIEIILVTFFFSMFSVYGNRATGVGNAAILMMILIMDQSVPRDQLLIHSLQILAGGVLYSVISLLLHFVQPYRPAQRALGECIREVARYLAVKAAFYDQHTELRQNYSRMVSQQVAVNEKQDSVREIFFKTRQIVEESTEEGRKLVFTFVETVDLFEDITAAYYDYASLRRQFGESGALEVINRSLKKIVSELEGIGMAVLSQTGFTPGFDYDEEVRQLKQEIDALHLDDSASRFVLRKIIVNIRNLLGDTKQISRYFETGAELKKTNIDHSHFVSHQTLDPRVVWNNLTLKSSVFRHAIRVATACILGYGITRIIAYGAYSYWILLTIAFILKPAFALTKQRNIERIKGTLTGGAIGVLLLVLITSKTALFVLMVVFMLGAYTFLRTNYLLMVVFTTPYVLILFSFLGAGFRDVAGERIIDTLIGCAIAFGISYLLFPRWESEQLKNFARNMVGANRAYLEKMALALSGQQLTVLDYKLARKEVYLHSANLSAAFQRMLSEPKSKQNGQKQIHEFVVLNHILFSNVASLVTSINSKDKKAYAPHLVQLAKKAWHKLDTAAAQLGAPSSQLVLEDKAATAVPSEADQNLMREQLLFIDKVSGDIEKISLTLSS